MQRMMKQRKIYDAIIVGSGAAGGIAAHVLVNKGLDVLLLDIGPKWDPATYYTTAHKWAYEMPYRGLGKPGQYAGLWKINAYTEHFYVNPQTDPYAVAPGTDFHWTRVHAVGGRTIVWGRVSLRFADFDFKPKTLQDGVGEDWPVAYADLAPYYDRTERFIGVFGTREGMAHLPDGVFQPAPPLHCGEEVLKRGAARLGIPLIQTRMAVLTRKHEGRAPCHYCEACGRGCDTFSRFSTLEAVIPHLLTKSNFTLRTGAAAHRVLVDAGTNRARGVAFVDTNNKQEYEVFAKTVVLGAGAMESTRILLNSATREHPRGLANSSGVLGHYLMDTFSAGDVSGYLPTFRGKEPWNDDGVGGGHALITRYVNLPNQKPRGRKVGALRGWQLQTRSGPTLGLGVPRATAGFGAAFKRRVRDDFPAQVSLRGSGECLPDFDNYCEIDPDGLKDRHGIPQLRFHTKWGANEEQMAELMYDEAEAILRAAGAEVLPYRRGILGPLGDQTHEVGTARMGADAKQSALNQFNQTHDVKNLFVVDGAAFASCPEKNPTLTIMALAWRASDYLAEELKRGNLS
jgi:choline dehydrogenase-like flavoprotein